MHFAAELGERVFGRLLETVGLLQLHFELRDYLFVGLGVAFQ